MKVWCVLLLAAAAVANAAAQRYLTKPVRFIVPFPPGGGADVIGRVLGAKLADKWDSRW